MRRISYLLLLMLFSVSTYAQQYKTADIIKKADSVMIATVGEDIFNKYYTLDRQSVYEYIGTPGKKVQRELSADKQTRGRLVAADVHYTFILDEYNRPVTDVYVSFDRELNIINPVTTAYIPKYILTGTDCNFIPRNKAFEIGIRMLKNPGIKAVVPVLEFDAAYNSYVWKIVNILSEYQNWQLKDKTGSTPEMIVLSAYSGKVLKGTVNTLMPMACLGMLPVPHKPAVVPFNMIFK